MSLKDLSKEQKQYAVLGALAAATLIILLVFGARISMSSINDAKEELTSLSGKIQNADRTLARRAEVSGEFKQTMRVLKAQLENAPPDRNYYSWATEVIYSAARDVGLEIDTIDEIAGGASKPAAPADGPIKLESYALRITAHGGFNNVKVFIKHIREQYPLVRFSGIDINKSASPDSHDVQLFMQWPFNLGQIAKNWDSIGAMQREMNLQEPDKSGDTQSHGKPKVADEVGAGAHTVERPPAARVDESSASPKKAAEKAVAQSAEPEVVEHTPTTEPVVVARNEPTPPAPRIVPEPERVVIPEQPEPEPAAAAPEPVAVPQAPVAAPEEKPFEAPAAMTESETEWTEDMVAHSVAGEPDSIQESEAVQDEPGLESDFAESEPVPVEPIQEADVAASGMEEAETGPTTTYRATEKSARMLKSLLNDNNNHSSSGALGSFLNELLEDTNEAK